ncbi:MAG: sugar kinase, partial [Lachnospiraceae bacterium]|nr:sugar kinase [Lachnospiraceae bacterium]
MKYDILTVGFPLVEIMRKEKDVPFDVVADFIGPYPSGDTCIVLDVAAKLGKKCCFFGPVGDDAFGKLVINRLKADGIETGYIKTVKDYCTAAVFVHYSKTGEREYMDFINNSACSTLNSEDIITEVIADSKWIHFSGEVISNCIDPIRREAMMKLLNNITVNSKVCLDPNFTIQLENMEEVMRPFINRADLILPSEGEARILMNTKTDEEACELLSCQGKIVALKRGDNGCDIYQKGSYIHINPFKVEEVDPTGCGDSFCAGFITGLLEEWPLDKVGRFANA